MPDSEKLTASLRLIDAETDDTLQCGRCGGPAIYVNRTTGQRICLSCVFHPPQFGPGYEWQGARSGGGNSPICRARSPRGGWNCTLDPGHEQLHEAWGGGVNPIMAWDMDGAIAYVERTGWHIPRPDSWQGHPFTDDERAFWCGARRDSTVHGMRVTCTLRGGHANMHEGWRPASQYPSRRDPVLAWAWDGSAYWEADNAR